MENEKIKNLFTGRQLDDKKWTSEMASADEDMGGCFFLQLGGYLSLQLLTKRTYFLSIRKTVRKFF